MKPTDKTIMQEASVSEQTEILYPERFIKNTSYYNSLIMMYRCVIREIRTKLEVLDDEFSVKYNRNPISSIKSRIKTPLSIYNKLQKLGYEFTEQNIREQLNDVAGIRVICSFIDDIYSVAQLLAEQDDITVLRIKDYIKNPKPNGYRSYHMIVELAGGPGQGITAEIQLRTIAIDFWATLEHQMKYKRTIPHEALIRAELKRCADEIASVDLSMQTIRELLTQSF